MAGRSGPKRPHPPFLLGGVEGSSEDRDSELLCPVCLDTMEEPYVASPCGHSFCHGCIRRSLELSPKCPQCATPLPAGQAALFPNVALHSLLVKRRKKIQLDRLEQQDPSSLLKEFDSLLDRQKSLTPAELARLQELLARRREALEEEHKTSQVELLKEFLAQLKRKKVQELVNIQQELERLEKDLGNLPAVKGETVLDLGPKRVRLAQHFTDLEAKYWTVGEEKLDEFQQDLDQLTRYSELRPLATLSYGSDLLNSANIVSSIEFDRDADYFAIAGVTKRIKVYEYAAVVRDLVDVHYPVVEMVRLQKRTRVRSRLNK